MVEDLINFIKNRQLEPYCRRVVQNYIDNPNNCFKNFLILYASLHGKYDHKLSVAVAARISTYKMSADKSKEIVDMHLLLYFNCTEEYPLETDKLKVSKKDCIELQKHSLIYLIQVTSLRTCKQYAYSFLTKKQSNNSVSCKTVNTKYQNDTIWELWNEMINLARLIGPNILLYCNSQLKIFQSNYDKTSCRKKFGIVLSVIDAIYSRKKIQADLETDTSFNISHAHVECMMKINLLYREMNHLTVPTMKEYLYDIAMFK